MCDLQLGDLRFDTAEALRALFLGAHPALEIPIEIQQARHLRRGAIHDLALLLDGRNLLSDVVSQGLQRSELARALCRVGRHLRQVGERALEPGDARLRGAHTALRLLLAFLERVEPLSRRLARAAQLLLPLAHPVIALRRVAQLGQRRIRVFPQLGKLGSPLQKGAQVALERQGLVELSAQLLDLAAQPLGVIGGVPQLRLHAALQLGHASRLLVQRGEHQERLAPAP